MTPYWLTCLQVAQFITLAPHVFGGVIVRARSGPVRERWLQTLEQLALEEFGGKVTWQAKF